MYKQYSKQFNLNNSIKVILSASGAERLNSLRKPFSKVLTELKVEFKAGDEYESQLWQLMADFGDMMSLTCTCPFENCELLLDAKDIKDKE